MVTNIIFDFNGTLLDDLNLTFDIEERMLKKHGLPLVTKDFYLHNFSFPVKAYYELIGYDFAKTPYEDLAVEFVDEYYAREEKETFLFEDCYDVLTWLKQENIHLYVLSASKQDYLERQLKRLGIFDLFDGVIGDNSIHAHGKINYGNEYLNAHEIDRSKTIMVGDTVHDFEVAEALNLTPIIFLGGHNSEDLFKTLNVKCVKNYRELYNLICLMDFANEK